MLMEGGNAESRFDNSKQQVWTPERKRKREQP